VCRSTPWPCRVRPPPQSLLRRASNRPGWIAAVAPASAAAIRPSANGKKASLHTTLSLSDNFASPAFQTAIRLEIHAAHLARACTERSVFTNIKNRVDSNASPRASQITLLSTPLWLAAA